MKYDELVSGIDQSRVNINACHGELVAQKGKDDAMASDLRSLFNTLGTLMATAGKGVKRGADKADYEKDLGMNFSRSGVRPQIDPSNSVVSATQQTVSKLEQFLDEVEKDGKIVGDRSTPSFVFGDNKSWNSTMSSIRKRIKAVREHGG